MKNQHVIGQLTVEIQGVDIASAAEYQRACSQQVRSEHFLSALNKAIDQVDQKDVVWQIQRLEIDLQIDRDEQFGPAFLEAFRQAIAQHAAHSNAQKMSMGNSITALALHFLEKGATPWSATEQQILACKKLLQNSDFEASAEFLVALEHKAQYQPNIWLRYIHTVGLEHVKNLLRMRYGFSAELIRWIEQRVVDPSGDTLEGVGIHLDSGTPISALRTWQWVLQNHGMVVQGIPTFKEKIIQTLFHQQSAVALNNSLAEQIKAQDLTPPINDEVLFDEAVFIKNAGLVLLAQFLPILFERAGLVQNRQFVDEEAQHSAVQLLQYLLNGEDQAWENELLLNKILCNVAGESPVNRFAPLSDLQREEADGMLAEVIRHWSVLKNTSIAGLREMFLARDGKLTRTDRNWRLQVERKAVDVLLERLPIGWGYSVIKLPWMEGVLYVEW